MGLLFESVYLDVLAAILVALGGLYFYFTWTYDYWKKKGIPYIKPVFFFGTVKEHVLLRLAEHLVLKQMYDEFQGHRFVGGFQFRQPFLLIRDPELIKAFIVKDFWYFHDRGFPVDEDNTPLSLNLFNLGGTRWHALRSKLTHTFTAGKMKLMYHLMEQCCEELRRHLKEPASRGEVLEVREMFAQFTTDVIGACVFGLQMNSMNDSNSDFRRMGRLVFELSLSSTLRRICVLFFPSIAKLFNFDFSSSEVNEFFLNAVKESIDYRQKNNVTRNDFIDLLLQIRNEENTEEHHAVIKEQDQIKMTDNLMAAQMFVFFVAGNETSATAMSFALYELALHPNMQTRLRDEIDSVLENNGGKFTYDSLQEMRYLDKVVSESLRKYPPASSLFRMCCKPYRIPGTDVTLDVGVRVRISVYALHHDPQYYPEPDRFDPERFSDENKAKRDNYTYLPFGQGPKNCIGMRFGLMQTKSGLASVLRDYEFSLCERTTVPIKHDPYSLVTASADGIWLKMTARKKCQ